MALTIPPYMTWIVVALLLAFLVLSLASENPRLNPLVENVPDYSMKGHPLVAGTTPLFLGRNTKRPPPSVVGWLRK
jgi:hypothetical protein